MNRRNFIKSLLGATAGVALFGAQQVLAINDKQKFKHIVYVDPEAPADGDGSQKKPFRTLAEAIENLPPEV